MKKVHKIIFREQEYLHGDKQNELNGGTCDEFLKLNDSSTCCSAKHDECYISIIECYRMFLLFKNIF